MDIPVVGVLSSSSSSSPLSSSSPSSCLGTRCRSRGNMIRPLKSFQRTVMNSSSFTIFEPRARRHVIIGCISFLFWHLLFFAGGFKICTNQRAFCLFFFPGQLLCRAPCQLSVSLALASVEEEKRRHAIFFFLFIFYPFFSASPPLVFFWAGSRFR